MTPTPTSTASPRRNLTLVAMIFAVAMMFIDQTIVSLAIPSLSGELTLSTTGAQWIVNGYLLSLAAFFVLGGKLADTLGHRRMLYVGVTGFAVCSALCGATPTGSGGEAWIIFFRVAQGAFAALLFPAALAIVTAAFPREQRGRALALFFGITGALTAVGPLAGGYLTEWTWRAIFWINVPVAIVALILTMRAKPEERKVAAPIDRRGASSPPPPSGYRPRAAAVRHLGLGRRPHDRRARRRRRRPRRLHRLRAPRRDAAGRPADLRPARVRRRLGGAAPDVGRLRAVLLLRQRLRAGRARRERDKAGTFLLVFFIGFASAAQLGGRLVDTRGARASVVIGCVVAAVGFLLWADKVPGMDFGTQWHALLIAGAGLGMVLGPASTDALNRGPSDAYGEITGITQTARNLGASVGLAVMGSIFTAQSAGRTPADVADATQTVAYIMAGIMVAAFVVARVFMARGTSHELNGDPAPAVAA